MHQSKLHDRIWPLVFETHPFPIFIFHSPPSSLKFLQSSFVLGHLHLHLSLKHFSLVFFLNHIIQLAPPLFLNQFPLKLVAISL